MAFNMKVYVQYPNTVFNKISVKEGNGFIAVDEADLDFFKGVDANNPLEKAQDKDHDDGDDQSEIIEPKPNQKAKAGHCPDAGRGCKPGYFFLG